LAEDDTSQIAGYLSCNQPIAENGAFWKYKNIHWEAGLIGQVLYLEATALGLKGTGIGCFYDDLTAEVLGLEKNYLPLYGWESLGRPPYPNPTALCPFKI